MPLLNKFVMLSSTKPRNTGNELSERSQLASIISNLQVILQSRRSTDISHNIGLEDFSDLSIDESLMHRLCDDIAHQIKLHESRLHSVTVELVENGVTRWLLSVTGKLASSSNEHTEEDVNFVLEIAKPAYKESKREINGVFL